MNFRGKSTEKEMNSPEIKSKVLLIPKQKGHPQDAPYLKFKTKKE